MKIDLKDYYDVKFFWKSEIPQIKLLLKPEFKIGKSVPMKSQRQPYSGANIEYYIHYFGELLGKIIFDERKKLFPKNKIVDWYIANFVLDATTIDELIAYNIRYSEKISKSLKRHYASDAGIITKQKLVERNKIHVPVTAKHNSELWKDPVWRDIQIKSRHESGMFINLAALSRERWTDPVSRQKYMDIANHPERKRKISIAVKKMWSDVRLNDIDKYMRMISCFKHKNYVCGEYKMNSIEYQIGSILQKLNVKWVYERLFHLEKQSFIPDFYLPEFNIIIECYGDFWHASPKMFNSDDYVHTGKTATMIWDYDNNKKSLFESAGLDFLIFWGSDINESLDGCEQIITKHINLKK